MEGDRARRRLAAIVAADVAGYSRLVGADEEGTLARLKALRRELIDPRLAGHAGRIVKTTGDGLLMEFGSAVDAVRCVLEIQRAMAAHEESVAENKRLRFRIGVHVGDIVVDGEDILGDGVNVAARLEQLAEPGGICLSGRAHEDVRGRLDLDVQDIGEHALKNIERPVRVFRLAVHADGAAPLQPTLALPDKPSIAVLPFQNMSGDPEQEYFSDGISEDIITALSRLHGFFVIARNSSFTYKGRSVDVKQVGRELGVRYLVEGSVRKSGSRIRITAQLIDCATAAHLWAERYDRDLADVFAIQDEITEGVVASVESQLYVAEGRRATRKPPASLDAWDHVMRAQAHLSGVTADGTRAALELLEEATRRDSAYARAHALWSWVTLRLAHMGWKGDIADVLPSAEAAANKAISLDPDDPWAHFAAGLVAHMQRKPAEAAVGFKSAIQLNPSFALAHAWLGMALASGGKPEEALAQVEKALRMSPRDPYKYSYYSYHALAHFAAGRYREAAAWAEKSIQERPEYMIGHRGFVVYSALAGDLDRARAALAVVKRLQPNISLDWVEANQPHPDNLRTRYIEGLRLAGLT